MGDFDGVWEIQRSASLANQLTDWTNSAGRIKRIEIRLSADWLRVKRRDKASTRTWLPVRLRLDLAVNGPFALD
jgi:hypothetical protein